MTLTTIDCNVMQTNRKEFSTCSGMVVPDARWLRELEGGNAKLKKLLAEAHLDIRALNTAFGVKR
jgi:hypothetical protein